MNDINLIVQYYKVKNSSDIKYRQKEIDTVLKINCNNIYIKKIYLLLEEDYELKFLTKKEHFKIVKVIIGKRLSYNDAFTFYNENLSKSICILSNADIYFDDSIKYLNNINWSINKLLLSPTRYEHIYLYDSSGNKIKDSNICVLYGMNQDLKKESPWVKSYEESVFTQDSWIWCCDKIDIKDCYFNLGVIGCDNLIASKFYECGFTLISCSKYICINHFDHLSVKAGNIKGNESFSREHRVGSLKDYKFIKSGNYFIDKNITKIENYMIESNNLDNQILNINVECKCKPLINMLHNCQIIYSSKNKNNGIKLNGLLCWEPLDNDKIITIKNNFLIEIHYIDIQGKPFDRNNICDNSFITKLQLFYSLDGIVYKESHIYDGISVHNYEYIKRIYLKEPILCYSIKIKILEYNIKPCLRLEIYYNKDNLNEIDKRSITFKNMVYNCNVIEKNRQLLSHDEIYNNRIIKIYKSNLLNYRYTELDDNLFWIKMKETLFNDCIIEKNILNEKILPGICVFTYVMNRKDNLIKNIKTWLNKDVNQLIILDWSSNEDYYNLIKSYNDKRILYVRVENENKFIRTYAQNIAARFCKYDKILKLDSDISITDDFFRKNIFNDGEFIAGNFICARDENERYTHGNVFLWLNDYFKINGYNELITTYGNDDSDFHFRLQILAGLKEKVFDLDTLYHNPHNDHLRKININIFNTNVEVFKHRYYLDKIPLWNQFYKLNQFDIKKIDYNYYQCIRNTFDLYKFTDEIIECEKEAINTVYNWYQNKSIQLDWKPNADFDYKKLYLLLIN